MPSSVDRKTLSGLKALWLLYSLFIIYGTLIPFEIAPDKATILSKLSHISWIPFIDFDGSRASIPDVVQNILLFVPFGLLGAISLNYKRYKIRVLATVILGFLLSTIVEILQLFTIDRTTSPTDLTTNVAGTLVGVIVSIFVLQSSKKWESSTRLRLLRQDRYFGLLLICCVVVMAGALQPFDFTLDIGLVASKVRAIIDEPLTKPTPTDEGVVFFRFVLLGYIWSLWIKRIKGAYFALLGLLFSSVFGVILEACQIIVRSRMPAVSDAIIVILGCAVGALFTELPLAGIPRVVWSALTIFLTWATAAIQVLSPFNFSDFGGFNWVPFLPYYERTTFVALSNFIESTLVYFPMGFILQYFHSRSQRTPLFIASLTIFLSFSLELAQAWIPGRYADITDVLGAIFGALVGSWICRLWVSSYRRT